MHAMETTKLIQLEELSKRLRAAITTNEPREFASLLTSAAGEFSDDELGKLFMVDHSTANRWRNGKTVPHPLSRQRVYQVLADRAAARLRSAKQRSAPGPVKAVPEELLPAIAAEE
jgi:hypothetical protein